MHDDPKLEERHLLDVLDRLLARAKAAGAEAADALIYESVSVATSYRMRRLEDLERSESGDCGLRVFIGKRQAFVSSTDFRIGRWMSWPSARSTWRASRPKTNIAA